jgi:hypothetical protein
MRINNGSIMVRPTLVVGLGGTGVLVCQWLEKYIRDLFDNRIPPFIRFLKLDTDALEEGGPPDASLADFYNLFQDLDIGAVVRDCAKYPELHPHLDWFAPLRDKLDAVFADYGCQGIPRLGRLVFTELRERIIHQAVSARFGELSAAIQQDMKGDMGQFKLIPGGAPAVHVAGSVCGGTGAGMLIDIAYNLRWWSRETFRRSAEIIGHLMLPEAFVINPVLQPKLRAVAAATLEQIEYLSDPRREDVTIRYPGSTGHRCFDRLTAPFNFLYLVNGQGDLGIGNRKHLVRMIARVIRAMILEPTSKLVASESNNKLADALGLYDPANGRRQCFASYGLWQGTPGHDHGDVLAWVGSRLKEMKDVRSATNEPMVQKIRQSLKPFLDVSSRTAELSPDHSFEYASDDGSVSVDGVLARLETHFKDKIEPGVRAKCSQIIQPADHHKEIIKAVTDTIERLVFEEKYPLGSVPAGLSQCILHLETWGREKQPSGESRWRAVKEQTKEKVVQGLHDCAKKKHATSVTHLKPSEATAVVQEILRDNWGLLVAACLNETLGPCVDRAAKVLRLRKQAADSLATLAAEGDFSSRVSPRGEDGSHQDEQSDGQRVMPRAENPQTTFATPLDMTDDPTANPAAPLGGKLRQNLVRPILRQVVFSLDEIKEGEGGIGRTEDRLIKAVGRLKRERQEFLADVKREKQESFYRGISPDDQAAKHIYFKKVTDIYERAAPKIDLNRANKYAEPLQVTISQHTKGCCVPDLLGHSLGADFREAHVSEEFEAKTDVWFQLLRINYGFCLPALATYEDYLVSARKYIRERTRFEDSNLWLDDRWYEDYLEVRHRWSLEKGRIDRTDRKGDAEYDEIKLVLGKIRKSMDLAFNSLDQSLIETPPSDIRLAMEAAKICTSTREHLMRHLSSLSATDLPALKRSFAKLDEDIHALLMKLDKPIGMMPSEQAMKIRQGWDVCRDLLRTANGGNNGNSKPQPVAVAQTTREGANAVT